MYLFRYTFLFYKSGVWESLMYYMFHNLILSRIYSFNQALDGKDLYIEFSGNLVPVTKSGVQLKFTFKAFRQNRLSFHVKVKDPLLDPVARMLFMREPKIAKGEPPQQPICVLNIVLPETIIKEEIQKKLKGTLVGFFLYERDM